MAAERSLASEWADFERMVLPPDCSEVQRTETRRGFYAGATALFHLIMSQVTPGQEPNEADFALMDRLDAEIKAYGAELAEAVIRARGGS